MKNGAKAANGYSNYHDLLSEINEIKSDLNCKIKGFDQWICNAKTFLFYREQFKNELLKIFHLMKVIIKQISTELNFDDFIYFLTYDELINLDDQSNQKRLGAMERKAYFEVSRLVEINKILIEGEKSNIKIKDSKEDKNTKNLVIKGKTNHHGEAEGICLVAENPENFSERLLKLREKGDSKFIGVFKGVEPTIFEFKKLKGIITEHGGLLSHTATIAREYNIPYITDVKIDLFQDGDNIRFETAKNKLVYTPKKV